MVWNEKAAEKQRARRAEAHVRKHGLGAGDRRVWHPGLVENLKRATATRVAGLLDAAATRYTVTGSGCWEWSGTRNEYGYGTLSVAGKRTLAHRWFWDRLCSPAGDSHVLHRCDNPPCVNPAHLFLGTHTDNLRDMWAKGRARPGRSVGVAHGRAKLTAQQAVEIRRRCAAGEQQRALALEYGVTQTVIGRIHRREAWAHVG